MPRKKKTEEPEIAVNEPVEDAVAEPAVPASRDITLGQVVVFRLGEQLYALPIESVQEIQQIVELTPVPGLSAALVGMIDLRGGVVPAIDLRMLLSMPAREYTLDTPMIFFHTHGRLVALLVDQVEDVVDVPEGCTQSPSNLYDLADRMIGICKLDEGLVVVLDPEMLVPDSALPGDVMASGEVPR